MISGNKTWNDIIDEEVRHYKMSSYEEEHPKKKKPWWKL